MNAYIYLGITYCKSPEENPGPFGADGFFKGGKNKHGSGKMIDRMGRCETGTPGTITNEKTNMIGKIWFPARPYSPQILFDDRTAYIVA